MRYDDLHTETSETTEGGKVKLVLIAEGGAAEEYFIIPTKSKRDLLVPAAEKGTRRVWDGARAIDLQFCGGGRFKTSPAHSTVGMFECPGCGGKFAVTDMCEDCGVCTSCCEPGCACDRCLAGRTD